MTMFSLDFFPVSGKDADTVDTMESPKNPAGGLHPLLEAALAFCLLYLPRTLIPRPATGIGLGTPGHHLALTAELSVGTALVLLVMARRHRIGSFFPESTSVLPGLHELAGGLTVFLALVVAGVLPILASSLAGWKNPVLASLEDQGAFPVLLFPFILLSSLAVGYSEELFFRVYAFGMLKESGLSETGAGVCTTLVFAGAHAAQGVGGILSAIVLGAVFQIHWIRKKEFHSIALGHAFYDCAVLILVLCCGAGI